MQKFEVILKNEKSKYYERFAILLFVLNGIAVCIFLTRSNYQELSQGSFPWIPIIVFCLFSLLLVLSTRYYRNSKYAFPLASASIVLFWFFLGYWWVGLAMLALLILYIISKREFKVVIEKEKILYPSFPSRVIPWKSLNNLIMKDGLLTIDFKNNKIIQQYADHRMAIVNEQEFNDFCREQLRNAGSSI